MLELNLPYIQIESNFPDNITIFILGGRSPSPNWLKSLNFQSETWAIDKGVDSCISTGIIPSTLVGDKDSADNSAWQWAAETGCKVLSFDSEKDLTDFQLALDIFGKKYHGKTHGIFLTGCWGGRFDHLWSILITFISHTNGYQPVAMADEKEGMLFMRGSSKSLLNFKKSPLAISLIPFTKKCQNVCIDGVRWPLDGATLDYNEPYSISNRLSDDAVVSVSLSNGLLGIYWVWQ